MVVPLVDRQLELDALVNALKRGSRVVVIQGVAAIGKTAFARHFALLPPSRQLFPGGIVQTSYFSAESVEQALRRHFSFPLSEQSLIILDDAEQMDDRGVYELRHLLQWEPRLHAILTSRKSLDVLADQTNIEMGGLGETAFRQLIENYVPVDPDLASSLRDLADGNPLVADLAGQSVQKENLTWEQVFSALQGFERPGILGPDGQPLPVDSEERSQLIHVVTGVNDEIIAMLKAEPEQLWALPPRRFEELVAELLARQGYEIQLSPPTKDGGVDIYVAKRDDLGSFLYLVECKRYTPPNKVGVEIVRALYGVVQQTRANAGIVATTSFFTSGAKELQRELKFQLHLRDYMDIQKWLEMAHRAGSR